MKPNVVNSFRGSVSRKKWWEKLERGPGLSTFQAGFMFHEKKVPCPLEGLQTEAFSRSDPNGSGKSGNPGKMG